MKTQWKVLIASGALLSAASLAWAGERTSTLEQTARALQMPAERLEVVREEPLLLPLTEIELKIVKVYDHHLGLRHQVALDSAGKVVDLDQARALEDQRRWQIYGNFLPDLAKAIASDEGGDEMHTVLIQYAIEERFIDKSAVKAEEIPRLIGPLAEAEDQRLQEIARQRFETAAASFGLRQPALLEQNGPFVTTELPSWAIERLRHERDIVFIGKKATETKPPKPSFMVCGGHPFIPQSLPSTDTDIVHGFGNQGAGVKLAIFEDGGQPTEPTACFNIAATFDPAYVQGDMARREHMTKVMGLVGNRYDGGACTGDWQGYAPEADIYYANKVIGAIPWMKSQGVNIINMSWSVPGESTSGSPSSRDREFDYLVTRYPFPSVFAAAGNDDDPAVPNPYVTSKGYNFLAVGDIENEDDGDFCDDTMAGTSVSRNPSDGRELPEIAAPGSTHCLLGDNVNGTSAASPVAASMAALIMNRNPSLKYWPQAIRAILLTTSIYQGADGDDWSWDGADGADGTGMVNALHATEMAANRRTTSAPHPNAFDYGSITQSSLDSLNYFDKEWKVDVDTTASRVRIALTWDSNTPGTWASTNDLDFDLEVHDPNGVLVAWSNSSQNNYEFIEGTPAMTGEYTIKISMFNPPATFQRYYGIGWEIHYECP